MISNYTQLKTIFSHLMPPYSFVFLDEVDKNLETVRTRSGDKLIRLATKSLRSRPVIEYLIQALGSRCSGLMCFHIDEILWLSEHIQTHFLMGYPQRLTEAQAKSVAEKMRQGIKIVHMIDSIEQVQILNEQAGANQQVFEVCIDLDMSLHLPGLNFGVFRSPLNELDKLEKLYKFIQNCEFIKCVGLMGYEAQIAGVGDKIYKFPLMNWIISLLKKKSTSKIYELRMAAYKKAQEYFALEFVNGGGSGSLEMTAGDKSVTEVTAGSAFYWPALFDSYEQSFETSAGYAMAVQRKPNDNIVTTHGGGYVASGSLHRNKLPVVHSPTQADFHSNEMAGEVQTPITGINADQFNIGDPIFFRHSKAGELFERFTDIQIIRKNKIETTWKSYRGEGKCFL
ncbi:MAG: amino acid aldolase [Halobacteriovoraceae bacterium]|nr:amino acid aldolase [Halobacteriovoraceae bacterium]|tara:strand:+ start:4046 stop:5236 length:1191 start_codon:yes stop_codon:yes gene_type:complete